MTRRPFRTSIVYAEDEKSGTYLYTMKELPSSLKPPRRHSMLEQHIDNTEPVVLFVVALQVIKGTNI